MNRFLVGAVGLFMLSSVAQAEQCLSYGPSKVRLTGTITRVVFPGRPNYESVAEGDEPEPEWVLHLGRPWCVNNGRDEMDPPEADITDMQLILQPGLYKKYHGLLGKRVTATGELSHATTGHHHTKVLMEVKTMMPAK